MRHNVRGGKLGGDHNSRKDLFRNLAGAVLEHDKVHTTLAKAKAVKSRVEKLITLAKTDTMHHRRLAFSRLQRKKVVKRLFEVLGPRFKDRNGGYLRILKLGPRLGDGAEMAQLEMV